MLLFTIATEDNYEISTQNNYYLKKVEYSKDEYEIIINEAKKYYFSYNVVADETDMSDNYHSDNTYYYSVNSTNVVVKDKKFYGVILHGIEKHHTYYLVATIEDDIIDDSELNGYNSIDRTYKLLTYDIQGEALDIAVKYYISYTKRTTRIKNNQEELFAKTTFYYYPLATDIIVKDNKAIGIKYKNHEFIFDDKSSLCFSSYDEEFCGYLYKDYTEYKLVKIRK